MRTARAAGRIWRTLSGSNPREESPALSDQTRGRDQRGHPCGGFVSVDTDERYGEVSAIREGTKASPHPSSGGRRTRAKRGKQSANAERHFANREAARHEGVGSAMDLPAIQSIRSEGKRSPDRDSHHRQSSHYLPLVCLGHGP